MLKVGGTTTNTRHGSKNYKSKVLMFIVANILISKNGQ
jgi:hypothetical protein